MTEPDRAEAKVGQETIIALVDQIKELKDAMQNQAAELRDLKTGGGPRLRQAVAGPTVMDSGRVQKWFDARHPNVFFSDHHMRGLEVLPARDELDKVREVPVRSKPIAIEFAPWTGPGSELRGPDGKKQLLPWGFCDLAKHPSVTSGEITVEQFKAHVEASRFFSRPSDANAGQTTIVFASEVAKLFVHTEYKRRAQDPQRQQAYEQQIAQMRPGAEKLGFAAKAPAKDSVLAAAGV